VIEPNSQVAAMAPYALTDLDAPAGVPLISLAQNASARTPSPLALSAAREALEASHFY
jgi:hypothetical protein